MTPNLDFISDNCAGGAPEVLHALMTGLSGHARGYGNDDATGRAVQVLRDLFEAPQAEVFLVPTGTAANALALSALCPPWGAIYCADCAHLDVDECGAPGFFTSGGVLRLLTHDNGRIAKEALEEALINGRKGDVHAVQPAALSLAQITERGALYRPEEIAALCDIAHGAGLRTHMDGARFANAVARLKCSPSELTWRAGIDILSLGATKSGALGAEAIICFSPDLSNDLAFRRKRSGHLLSKMRVVSLQIEAMFADNLWLQLAQQANDMTDRLADGLAKAPWAEVMNDPQGNITFARFSSEVSETLMAAGARFATRKDGADHVIARLVTAFDTVSEDVDAFLAVPSKG